MLREAIQNSCDAAKLGTGPRILIRLRTLTPDQVAVLRDQVLAELPFIASSAAALTAFLGSNAPRVLEICDFGTTGLGGPTRADRIPAGIERTDFIDFMRNVGTRRNTDLGGGTYGFGKASLYRTSRCSTILIDTLAHDPAPGADSRRLMGCHLGESGDRDEGDGFISRYTGRHWWGVRGEGDDAGKVGEPATGDAARALSQALGAAPRDDPGATGTSILILDPDLRLDAVDEDGGDGSTVSSDASDIGVHILERALWNFWPRMLETTPDDRRVTLTVEIEGVTLETPRPEHCPPLDLFARAMNEIRAGKGREIRSYRPQTFLGRLAISRGVRADRLPAFRAEGLLPKRSSCIALMRPAEMVVCYMEGPVLPDERTEWAGVFVTSDEKEVEEAFASSEPAAHDVWDPSALPKGPARTWVKMALVRLKEAVTEVAAPGAASGGSEGSTGSVAAVAGMLGAFLAGVGAGGPSRGGGRGGGGGGTPGRRHVSQPTFERLEMFKGERTALFTLTVSGRGAHTLLDLTPTISMDGGDVAAAGLDVVNPPAVIEVEGDGDASFQVQPLMDIGDFEGELTIRVSVPDDCAVGLRASLLAADPA
ncbi:hypothetical protein [Brevundimonas subvibrioides]|uniref:hypothetical protein n=1 Tax=Brevundimonas subvibrioides TaxID=74313 RepID=UPI0022B31851|nr:hypothetical protein [Brevundimonas subvibrioides]